MQSGREEEWYAIKFCFKIGKYATETYEMLQTVFGASCMNRTSVFQWYKRYKRKAKSLWGIMSGAGGVRKSIHQSWLAKVLGLRLGLLYWGFKGVQEKIPSEEASNLQIGSMSFPPGQFTSRELYPCHRLLDNDEHQESSSPFHSPDLAPCDFCLFPKLRGCRYETIEQMKEAVTKVIDTLTQEDFHGAFN